MGLREQFVQRLMPYLTQPHPISSEEAFSQSFEIAQWVRQWITEQNMPTNSLQQTVAATLAFKEAIGASTALSLPDPTKKEQETIQATIHRCPIAGLSRMHPNLCYITCGVVGSVTSHYQGPVWVSVHHTLAWDDQPCQLVISRSEPLSQEACRAHFPVTPDTIKKMAPSKRSVSAEIPKEVHSMSALIAELAKTSPNIADVLAAASESIGLPLWFEDHTHRTWGTSPPRDMGTDTFSQPVFWHRRTVGYVYTSTVDGQGINNLMDILAFVARLVSTCWAEQAASTGYWMADAESRFVSLLVSPNGPDKSAWLQQWDHLWPTSNVCPANAIVWHGDSTESADDMPVLQQMRHIGQDFGVPTWFALLHKTYWTGIIRTAELTSNQLAILKSTQRMLSQHTHSSIYMGLGHLALEPGELSRSFTEACEAATLARVLGHDGVLAWDDIPGVRLVPYLKENAELLRLCHEFLEPLKREDRKHGSQLMLTLHTYIKCKMSAKKTSEALYIHPGTLKYRLRRIQAVTAWDFQNPYALFELLTCILLTNQDFILSNLPSSFQQYIPESLTDDPKAKRGV